MPQQPQDRQFVDLRPGLVTEGGYLNSPPGATTDEANFRISIDGSRRRRRGLAAESGGSTFAPSTDFASDHAVTSFKWKNAGGDADKDFIVIQLNRWLYIFNDTGDTLSTQLVTRISLLPFSVTGVDADVEDNPVHCASGTGVLLVCGRYIEPFYVEYNSTTGAFTTATIQILERDFHTIPEGGVRYNTEPGSLSDTHKYNLINRGWKQTDIDAYFTHTTDKYPALGMHWYKGYVRAAGGTNAYYDHDGVRSFSGAKMEAEPFSNASAPTGSLLINPFDTTEGYQTAPGDFAIANWTVTNPSPEAWEPQANAWTININVPGHNLLNPTDSAVIYGQHSLYTMNEGKYTGESPDEDFENVPWSMDGEWTTTYVDADNFTISVPGGFTGEPTSKPAYWNGWDLKYDSYGRIATGAPLANAADGYSTNERPTVCGWFAGRAWFAGIKHPQLVDRVYFSRLILPMHREFGECLQRNDPTDETFNALLPDDGGVIVIADLGNVNGMLDYNGSHLIFSDQGVWEVSGANRVFTADNLNVRRLASDECTSRFSPIICDGVVFFTGTKGIFMISPQGETGILYAQNISVPKIQKVWNAIPETRQKRVFTAYDDANKQVYFLYDDSATAFTHFYTKALVFDLRLQAFSKLVFPGTSSACIVGATEMRDADESETYKKVKFFVQSTTGTVITVCDMEQDDFTDFDGAEQDAYLITAYDNIGSWVHRRQAPIAHVFCGKTETGFTDPNMEVVNPGSLLMQARWDWTDNVNAGEWGTSQQVYRHVRAYTPSGTSDTFDTGYPVVVTRNKIRGRGRSLHLRFLCEAGYDAHLLGYSLQYKISGRQ